MNDLMDIDDFRETLVYHDEKDRTPIMTLVSHDRPEDSEPPDDERITAN